MFCFFVSVGCGGIIKKANLTITPPKNGDTYETNANCKWILIAPPGHLIQLTFTLFDMEDHNDCRYDYVAIYDSVLNQETADSHPISKSCGNEIPPIITSSSSALTIFFKSDESVGGQGFVATYAFIDGRNCKLFLVVY